jgi:hypothetical protein
VLTFVQQLGDNANLVTNVMGVVSYANTNQGSKGGLRVPRNNNTTKIFTMTFHVAAAGSTQIPCPYVLNNARGCLFADQEATVMSGLELFEGPWKMMRDISSGSPVLKTMDLITSRFADIAAPLLFNSAEDGHQRRALVLDTKLLLGTVALCGGSLLREGDGGRYKTSDESVNARSSAPRAASLLVDTVVQDAVEGSLAAGLLKTVRSEGLLREGCEVRSVRSKVRSKTSCSWYDMPSITPVAVAKRQTTHCDVRHCMRVSLYRF